MNIRFRDVSSGIVEARAIIELAPGIYINEITILRKNHEIIVELPKKSFKGRNGRIHHIDILTFESENKKILWIYEIKAEYKKWRKKNRKVLVYESESEE